MFVLTGGPCSGKSTLLRGLAAVGLRVVEEAASQVLSEGEGAARRRRPLELQRAILRRQIELEREALVDPGPAGAVFSDRGVGDHFAYLRIDGLEPSDELLAAWEEARERYRAVFLLEPGPFYEQTAGRSESPERARRLHDLIQEEYTRRHPRVIPVPWEGIEQRVDRVLVGAGLRDAMASRPARP